MTFSIPHQQLASLCRCYGVQQFYLFGSAITDAFNPEGSDVDALVIMADSPPTEQGEALLGLWDELENLFQRKVDLLTMNSLKNPYLIAEIERTKKLIYDAARP